MTSAMTSSSGFDLVASTKVNNQIPVEKYQSKTTGLSIVIAQVEGPVVNGYFCLATEAHDDDGLPHTLEHLIFLGSQEYPYKGVLDLLANRCLSSGTNAWTDTDHTCYTMTTAGSEGFLNLLPVYLDHILFPTLNQSGFVTEVHHVTEEGEDGGVVYCEMQGRENSGESRTHLEMLRALYPGLCGYKSETGGIMKNLRESTTNQKVRDYHAAFYRAENLSLIITGQVQAEEVFSAIRTVEEKIQNQGPKTPFSKPWQSPVPPLTSGKVLSVPYPADEEDNGMVYVAWRGPAAVKDLSAMSAIQILMEYLTETSVSPLVANFVEIENPLASEVNYFLLENSTSGICLSFENVPSSQVAEVEPQLDTILRRIVSGDLAWDSSRLETVIHRRILELRSQVENDPHDFVAMLAIADMLYSGDVNDFSRLLNTEAEFRRLASEPASFWTGLVASRLLDQPRIVCQGVPSTALQASMKREEEERIGQRRREMGADGLAAKSAELAAATAENDIEPPTEVLRSVNIPGTGSIQFHPITSSSSASSSSDIAPVERMDLGQMPVFFQLDQVNSNFVTLSVVMNTAQLPQNLRSYLPLFLELILESPILEGETVIPYEEVVAALAEDFLSFGATLGLGGYRFLPGKFSQAAILRLQTEPEKYAKAVGWLRKLLYCTKLTSERVRVLATKMENSVAELKRDGNTVVKVLQSSLLFREESNREAANIIRQQKFLKELVARLDSSPEAVISDLEEVRHHLTEPQNMMVHLAASLERISRTEDLQSVWSQFLPPHIPKRIASPVSVPEHTLTRNSPTCSGVITGLGSCDSAFFVRCTPSITDHRNENYPAVFLFIQYLTQTEGPMWRQIRGQGLAYGYSMTPSVDQGQLHLSLYRATHPVKAYAEAKRIALSYVEGEEQFDPTLLEAAKSSLIFEIIELEKSVGDLVNKSLLNSFQGVDKDFTRELLGRIDRVTIEDLKRVGSLYIRALFDGSSSSCTSVVCSPGKVDEIVEGFKSHGINLSVLESLDQSINQ